MADDLYHKQACGIHKNNVSVGFESGVYNECLDFEIFITHSDLCKIGLAASSFKGETPQSMG